MSDSNFLRYSTQDQENCNSEADLDIKDLTAIKVNKLGRFKKNDIFNSKQGGFIGGHFTFFKPSPSTRLLY